MGQFDTPLSAQSRRYRTGVITGFVSLCILVWFGLTAAGCNQEQRLERILHDKKLIVVTRNAPTTYYEGREGLTGFEYDLVNAFADDIGVEVEFVVKDTLSEIIGMIESGAADLAAAGLTRTEQRRDGFLFSRSYQKVEQQVVCRRGGPRPDKPADLVGLSITVPALSSYVEQLQQLQQGIPQLSWQVDQDNDTEYLLEQVWLKKLDCTIGDSNIVAINRRYMPELVVQFAISEPQPLAWMLPPDATGLRRTINDWFEELEDNSELNGFIHKHYGFIDVFDYVDTRTFKRRIKQLLPRYEKMFRQAARKHKLDWTLLAAQAYQESHWNPRARSPTGVRGMMMLTLNTAQELGIENRLHPETSIEGGARYLNRLRKRLPVAIQEPDRTWIALAAYNVGMGHVHDAQHLAKKQGKNPHLWRDLKKVLPLLAQKKYYQKLKHGYARGREPVRYVQAIRDYQDILVKSIQANR